MAKSFARLFLISLLMLRYDTSSLPSAHEAIVTSPSLCSMKMACSAGYVSNIKSLDPSKRYRLISRFRIFGIRFFIVPITGRILGEDASFVNN